MSRILNFKNLLLFSNAIASFSGFIFISIDSKTFQPQNSVSGWIYYALMFTLSFVAISARYYLPVASITRSMILEVIVNVLNSALIRLVCVYKIINFLNRHMFWKVLKELQWINKIVNIIFISSFLIFIIK